MLRDPTGTTDYSGLWKHDDAQWTAPNILAVPGGINPTTSNTEGIFIIPSSYLKKEHDCISYFAVAHFREAEGYATTWID